jgi:hypothetical protein
MLRAFTDESNIKICFSLTLNSFAGLILFFSRLFIDTE